MPQSSVASDVPEVLAFTDVFETYRQPIYNYLRRMTENAAQADDLTQEVFIRVYRGLPGFRGDASVTTWLYQIARNVFYDYTRQASTRRDRANLALETLSGGYDSWADEKEVRPEPAAERREMSDCVQDHANTLPDSYRDVLALHDMMGLKNQQIAEALGISLATVKIRLHRARKKLHESLTAGCDFGHDERGVLVCESKSPGEASDAPGA
jgi:RNA polymerase sigma-70 factor (ECF subfamily)